MKTTLLKALTCAMGILLFTLFPALAQKQMEKLNRGVVAVRSSTSQVFISWRVFGYDPANIGFNLYRGTTKLNTTPITGATNYTDNISTNSAYTVKPVMNGVEQASSESANVWTAGYKEISLNVPAGGTTPASEAYTYSPNDASVGDVDGDGEYEILFLWEPSNAKDNSQSGYTGNVYMDAYKLNGTFLWRIDLGKNIRAGAHYSPFIVYDLDGDGKAEVVCKTAPGTKDGLGNYLTGAATGTDNTYDYRNTSGYILTGPEYLTIFQGQTGKELQTISYGPPRGTVSDWGDGYGNRVDRFIACLAFLDGKTPSVVMCRGYYTRTVLVAYNWKNSQLTEKWRFDTNDNLTGKDGNAYSTYTGQGNHNLGVADVDGDGYDEIEYGAMTVDHDGVGLFNTKLGHGDAQHLTIFEPYSTKFKQWSCHEDAGNGATLRDASNGKILYQLMTPGGDNGRAMAADIDPNYPGLECWTSGTPMVTSAGTSVLKGSSRVWVSSYNFAIWWDGDLSRELLDGSSGGAMSVKKWAHSSMSLNNIMTFSGTASNNGTKANPSLTADILGDWREEVIVRSSDNTKLRIYTTTTETTKRIYTLMHDPVYREGVARENVGYNQPPHTGFFLGNDMGSVPVSPFQKTNLVWNGNSGSNIWDVSSSSNWLKNNTTSTFAQNDTVLFDMAGINSVPVTLTGTLAPGYVTILSAKDYTFSGSGSLSGTMGLLKAGLGTATLNGNHSYTDTTIINQGTLLVNGTLSNSPVRVDYIANIGGTGTISQPITFGAGAGIAPGAKNAVGTITFANAITLPTMSKINVDISSSAADKIMVNSNVTISDTCTIVVTKLNGEITAGTYPLISYTGTFSGNLAKIGISGIVGQKYSLQNASGTLSITVEDPRVAATAIWTGANSNIWDFLVTENWNVKGAPGMFSKNDTVVLDATGKAQNAITLTGTLPIGKLIVNGSTNYTLSGSGDITGTGGIYKSGTGNLNISGSHSFKGSININGGSLTVGSLANANANSSLGASTSTAPADIALSNTKLIYTGTEIMTTDRGMTLTGSDTIHNTSGLVTLNGVIAGTGKFVKTGAATLMINTANSFSGGTVIKEGILSFGGITANTSGLGSGPITLEGGNWTLFNNESTTDYTSPWQIVVPTGVIAAINAPSRGTFTGSLTGGGTVTINVPATRTKFNGDWSTFTGTVIVTGSQLRLGTGSYGSMGFNLNSGVTASYVSGNASSDATGNVAIGELSGVAGSYLYNDNWTIGAKNTNSTFSGVISGNSLTKAGTGILTLAGANVYTGATSINAGTLNVTGSIGSSTVTVATGGILAGTGTLAGTVTVASGAMIAPGDATVSSSVGRLTVTNTITLASGSSTLMNINKTAGTKDRLVSTGAIKLGGTLALNLTGTFAAADTFRLFVASSITGAFSSITPANPGAGLSWDTTQLRSGGILAVKGKQVITFNPIPTQFVGGSDYDPAAVVTPTGATVTYTSDNIDIATIVDGKIRAVASGSAVITATVSGIPYYRDTTATQSVDVSTLTAQVLTFDAVASKTYGDEAFAVNASSDKALTSITYSIESGANVLSLTGNTVTILKAGTAKIKAYQAGDATYAPANTWITITVNKAPILVTANNQNITYGQTPTFTYQMTGFGYGETSSVISGIPACSAANFKAGSRTITIGAGSLASDNYTFNFATGTLNVDSATLTIAPVNKTITYGASIPTYDYTATGFVNGETSILALSGKPAYAVDNYNAGVKNINILKGTLDASNYRFVFNNGTLTVNKAVLDVTANDKIMIYGDATPEFNSVFAGFVNGEDASVISGTPDITSVTNPNAGNYSIVITKGTLAATNYDFNFWNGYLTVGKATLAVKADDQAITYGQTLPSLTYKISGYVAGDDASVVEGSPAVTADDVSAGVHAIQINSGSMSAKNYNFDNQNGTLTVSKVILTVKANDNIITYGQTPSYTYRFSGFVAGEDSLVINGSPLIGLESVDAGTQIIHISAGLMTADNYDFNFVNALMTIGKANLNLQVKDTAMIYGQQVPVFAYKATGLASWDASLLKITTDTLLNAGKHVISANTDGLNAANYTIDNVLNGTLTVNKATLTVTAPNATRKKGESNPTFELTYEGFVGSDNVDSLDVKPSSTCEAKDTSEAGIYLIEVTRGDDNNYSFAYQNGTLTVIATPETLTDAAQKTNITVYPNPVSSTLYIKMSENATIEVCNLNGMKITSMKSNDKVVSIDMATFPASIYLVKIITNTGVATYHVVKK